jgi:hypothetical protein
MIRNDGLFELYDENKNQLFKTANREELALYIKKFLDYGVYLLNQENKYQLAHPVYNYLFNYIEQKEIKCCEFASFKGLHASKNYYDDLIYNILGVRTDEYGQLKVEEKTKEKESRGYKKSEDLYDKILGEINDESNKDVVSDSWKSLVIEMKKHEEEYSIALNKLSRVRQKVLKMSELKQEIESLISNIKEQITGNNKQLKHALKHQCPLCDSTVEDNGKTYFNIANSKENNEFKILSLEGELLDIERKLSIEKERYDETNIIIKEIETKIKNNDTDADQKIKLFGIRKIKSDILYKYDEIKTKRKNVEKEIKEIKSKIRAINKARQNVDNKYNLLMSESKAKYNLLDINAENIKTATSKFIPDGTVKNIASVVWMTNLLKIKYEFNKDSIRFPLIYDTPNNANLTKNNDKNIFKLIFNSLPVDGQVITSTIGFDKDEHPDHKINVIKLTNEQYRLLNKEDYNKCYGILKGFIN